MANQAGGTPSASKRSGRRWSKPNLATTRSFWLASPTKGKPNDWREAARLSGHERAEATTMLTLDVASFDEGRCLAGLDKLVSPLKCVAVYHRPAQGRGLDKKRAFHDPRPKRRTTGGG